MSIKRLALLGTHPPRRCGIATFTADLAASLKHLDSNLEILGVAVSDHDLYDYPDEIEIVIQQDDLAAYEAAADTLNARSVDVVCVQHEFGIFGGPAGSYLLAFMRRVHAPVVTTLHTVLEDFTPEQQAVVEEILLLSSRIVVMSERARRFLAAFGIPTTKLAVIHHGVHVTASNRAKAKTTLHLSERLLILTFGLLSPNKGIETAIRAMPSLIKRYPSLIYMIVGATHPQILAQYGEAYRNQLFQLARNLGVAEHVVFDGRFVDLNELSNVIDAADIYLIPYLNQEQITSGTLAYAVGNGKAVVSTPFWYANELLADNRGRLVPFRDPLALSNALFDLLNHPCDRLAMEEACSNYGRQMAWPVVAAEYGVLFWRACLDKAPVSPPLRPPPVTLNHVSSMTDSTGIFQHAFMSVPNFAEGYTTDDNARALQLAALVQTDEHANWIATRTLSFLHHALTPSTGRFHNFMTFDRRWSDLDGGDNTQARAVRALVTAARELTGRLGNTANELLARSWSALDHLNSPRAQSIALIALADREEHQDALSGRANVAHAYAQRLLLLFDAVATPAWSWFEPYLSYSNAKLPHGLIAYGRLFNHSKALATGLNALNWLERQQTAPDGSFLPIGSDRRYERGAPRPLWDAQPIEAYATVSANFEAYRATRDIKCIARMRRAVEWLLGRNALNLSLYDAETGGSRDGLHRDRANENEGAESTLALWLSLTDYDRALKIVSPLRVPAMQPKQETQDELPPTRLSAN